MATDVVVICDKMYKENLLNSLYTFTKTMFYTDVTLELNSKMLHVHKVVLSAASDVFATMLQTNMREKFEGKINFKNFGLKDSTVDDLIEYIYTGRLELCVDNVEELLICSNIFMIGRLREDCCEFMAKVLAPVNCLGILSIAAKFGCEKLAQRAIKLIQEEFLQVMNENEFLHLSKEEIFDVLSNDSIEVPCEDIVLKAFLKWLEFDYDKRSQYFEELFQCIRVPFITDAVSIITQGVNQYHSIIAEVFFSKMASNSMGYDENENKIMPRRCLNTSDVIMTTGGYDGNSCLLSSFAFPLGNNKWGHLAPMLVSRHDHGTVSLNNKLFVVGGFNSHMGPLNRVEYFNSIRNRWEEVTPMLSKRKSLGVCVFNNKLFVSGGLDGNYNALDSVEYYDDSLQMWTNFIPMNQARYSHGLVANDKGLFAIGGWKLTTAEHFHDGQWHMIAPLNITRAGATSIVRNNKIYVFGGYSDAQCVSSVEIYDIDLDYWSSGASSRICRWRAGSALVENTIYIIGGRNSTWQYLDEVESYNLDEDEWKEEQALPCKIMGLRCSVVKVPKHAIR